VISFFNHLAIVNFLFSVFLFLFFYIMVESNIKVTTSSVINILVFILFISKF
jgi:hypothetical protein